MPTKNGKTCLRPCQCWCAFCMQRALDDALVTLVLADVKRRLKAGMALAFDEQAEDYDAAMADAITAAVGVWQPGVNFEEPWKFRRRETPGGYR